MKNLIQNKSLYSQLNLDRLYIIKNTIREINKFKL